VSWDKVLGCVVCRFHVAVGEKLHADKFSGVIVWSVAKLAGINLRKFGSFSYWFDNLGFTTDVRLSAMLFTPYSWGYQLCKHQQVFWRRCRGLKKKTLPRQLHASKTSQVFWHHCQGERRFLQGKSLASNLLLCYCFALFYFYLHHFMNNTKKLVPL
jgi:hypothetical protein